VTGFVVVTPHVSAPNLTYRGKVIPFAPGPLGPMKTVRPTNVGKVRVGYVDRLGDRPRFRFVPIAPAFDPLADSMVPVR